MSDSTESKRPGHVRHSFRSRHRAQSHAAAHDLPDHKPLKIIDHPLVARDAAQLVTRDDELSQLLQRLFQARGFAYDSEFIGELTYHPKLCLIQVSTTDLVALVDPLAPLDLTPFWNLLSDPAVEKVVHAGEQDIEPVARLIGRPCANVFDTQIAAGFVGLAFPVALGKLVGALTGAKLGKGLTFTHWDQRPLSNIQLRYAADDVRYLPAARDALGKRLEQLGHAGWAADECAALCDPKRYEFDPDSDFLRLRGAGKLSASGLAVLRELAIWRDSAARAADVPPRAYLKDEILVEIARHPPKSIDKLARIRGLPRPVEHEHGQTLIDLTARALSNPLKNPPQHPHEPTPAERFRADSIWALVQSLCLGQSLDPNVVASRQEVAELDRLLNNGGDISEHRLMHGWRREAVGQKLLDLVQGQSELRLRWKDRHLSAD